MSTAHVLPDAAGGFDLTQYLQALACRGHKANWPYTVRKTSNEPQAPLTLCEVAAASRAGYAVWTFENEPYAGFSKPKAKNTDIAIYRNFTMEAEYPSDPGLAHRLAMALRAEMVRLGLIPPGDALDDSGAGFHFAIPIVPIITADYGGGEIVNQAMANIVHRFIMPIWARLCDEQGVSIKLGSFDISRIMSYPGTYRPADSKPNEVAYLRHGYVRRWLAPHDVEAPVRVESAVLTTLITTEAIAILQAKQEPPVPATKATLTPIFGAMEIEAWIERKAATLDVSVGNRSNAWNTLVLATYQKYGPDAPRAHAELIDRCTGSKYGRRATREVERSLQDARPREEHPPTPADTGELLRLRTKLSEVEAERDRLKGEVVALADEIAKLKAQAPHGTVETIERLERENALLKGNLQVIDNITGDLRLSPIERVVGTKVAIKVGASIARLKVGSEPLRSEPKPLDIQEVERELGICALRRYLAPVAEANQLSREIRTDPILDEDGRPIDYRSTVWIGPPTGTPAQEVKSARRAADTKRQKKKREAQAQRIAELEEAARMAAEHGCPTCGGDLIATGGYRCTTCGREHTVSTIANPSKAIRFRLPIDISNRRSDSDLPEQPPGNTEEDRHLLHLVAAFEESEAAISVPAPATQAPTPSGRPLPATERISGRTPVLVQERKSQPFTVLAESAPGVPLPAGVPRPDWPCPRCGTSDWHRIKRPEWYCSTCEAGYGPPAPVSESPPWPAEGWP